MDRALGFLASEDFDFLDFSEDFDFFGFSEDFGFSLASAFGVAGAIGFRGIAGMGPVGCMLSSAARSLSNSLIGSAEALGKLIS